MLNSIITGGAGGNRRSCKSPGHRHNISTSVGDSHIFSHMRGRVPCSPDGQKGRSWPGMSVGPYFRGPLLAAQGQHQCSPEPPDTTEWGTRVPMVCVIAPLFARNGNRRMSPYRALVVDWRTTPIQLSSNEPKQPKKESDDSGPYGEVAKIVKASHPGNIAPGSLNLGPGLMARGVPSEPMVMDRRA